MITRCVIGISVLVLLSSCAALNPQSPQWSLDQIKQLSEMANVSGCAGGWVAGVGIGSLRVAMSWGQPDEDTLRYCVRE